jgi:hypothetical protein
VVGVAVDLDDQARVPPREIDLDSLNAAVDVRSRQTVAVTEREEALLQFAASEDRPGGVSGQHRS